MFVTIVWLKVLPLYKSIFTYDRAKTLISPDGVNLFLDIWGTTGGFSIPTLLFLFISLISFALLLKISPVLAEEDSFFETPWRLDCLPESITNFSVVPEFSNSPLSLASLSWKCLFWKALLWNGSNTFLPCCIKGSNPALVLTTPWEPPDPLACHFISTSFPFVQTVPDGISITVMVGSVSVVLTVAVCPAVIETLSS